MVGTAIYSPRIASLNIAQRQFLSFEEVEKTGALEVYQFLKENKKCRDFILAPVCSVEEEEIILYWGGSKQNIPGGTKIFSFFERIGYVPLTPHPSLLVQAMGILTEEELLKQGFPPYVNIVMLTPENCLLPGMHSDKCFLGVWRHKPGSRLLNVVNFNGGSNGAFAFLVRKKFK